MHKDLSHTLKNFRHSLGHTQEEMAAELLVPLKTYIHWEHGRPAPESVQKTLILLSAFNTIRTRLHLCLLERKILLQDKTRGPCLCDRGLLDLSSKTLDDLSHICEAVHHV